MQKFHRSMVAFALVLACVSGSGMRVIAQDATPTPITCTGTPRTEDFLVTILSAPTPTTTPTAIASAPVGAPVDDATRVEVETVVQTLTACVNAGDYLRAFAWFDDAYLRRIIDPQGLMTLDVAAELGKNFATPSSSDEIGQVTIAMISVTVLPDGTVSAIFTTTDSNESTTDLYILAKPER